MTNADSISSKVTIQFSIAQWRLFFLASFLQCLCLLQKQQRWPPSIKNIKHIKQEAVIRDEHHEDVKKHSIKKNI